MADIHVSTAREPASDPVPMLYISIEGDSFGRPDDAELSFHTAYGFGFRITARDAATLASKILTLLREIDDVE